MLGVCYYPEHWSQDLWHSDAVDMKSLGLDYVRIGEFCWSRIELHRDQFDFLWLDKVIDILSSVGLKIVFGTPTATPPKWLIDEFPEILPIDPVSGKTRGFGSRRHYDFSSEVYRREAARITEVLAKRYGSHDAIVGWQTDNELCCHDTTLSGSESAKHGFRQWCKKRYSDINNLNAAWGTVFWSMEYNSFDEIELPIGTVTEANPAHQLAYRRYSSDQVIAFHDEMVAIIRRFAPGKWITHNFIPKEDMSVDTYALGAPLDFASYDNYPLGRTDMAFADASAEKASKYMRTGHPDLASFYHDTTRSFSAGVFWVMEQQPGPVNWAPHNPYPLPGMVRLWSLEAFAHGAACVSYFRWRQVPFAQEQMHAGLKLPNNGKAQVWPEIEAVRREIDALNITQESKLKSPVAFVTDVQSLWVSDIERQGAGYDFKAVEFAYYSAFRQLGVDVDFVSPDADIKGYKLIIVPCLPVCNNTFVERCKAANLPIVFGPRSGSKTTEFSIPHDLAPGPLQDIIPVKVSSVETLRPDCREKLHWNDQTYVAHSWCEQLDVAKVQDVIATYKDGNPAILQSENTTYIGTLTCDAFLRDFFHSLCAATDIKTYDLPKDLRVCHRGQLAFAFNYGDQVCHVPAPENAVFQLGERLLSPQGVAVWRLPEAS
ncbi:beta-galactosidase [Kordiimonas aquimaris]|uniref:beta-galactosidase n=1 Tax=Kordiimonas aquimaris TaxID=707591 RepID=UPI0021D3DB27|nr:beta-galactosidase [Kordiimonas aquimaris]